MQYGYVGNVYIGSPSQWYKITFPKKFPHKCLTLNMSIAFSAHREGNVTPLIHNVLYPDCAYINGDRSHNESSTYGNFYWVAFGY